jgi:hypothetical protein
VFDREIQMGPGDVFRHVTQLAQEGDASLRARVDAAENALGIDDEAFAWLAGAEPLKVAIVGRRTEWLRALIARTAGVRATFVEPDAYRPGSEDVAIFDRWAPADSPSRPALYFAPPLDTPWLSGDRSDPAVSNGAPRDEIRPRWDTPGSHPVLRGVDPLTMRIDRARAYAAPGLVPVAQSARGTPLVYVGNSATQRVIVVTFGSGESNLVSAPGFPVLVGNALDWLARPAAGTMASPGGMTFDGNITRVTGPDGKPVPLAVVDRRAIGVLRDPGLYVAEGGGSRSTIAVNAGDPQISNLTRTSLNAADRQAAVPGLPGGAWWMYCAAAAFALILAEWWTWQRRITV